MLSLERVESAYSTSTVTFRRWGADSGPSVNWSVYRTLTREEWDSMGNPMTLPALVDLPIEMEGEKALP